MQFFFDIRQVRIAFLTFHEIENPLSEKDNFILRNYV